MKWGPEEGYEVVPKPAANDLVKYLTGLRQTTIT